MKLLTPYNLFFLVHLIIVNVNAQQPRFRTFSTNEGLSSYNADKIIQDAYGFIWITTQDGINRFDGREFVTVKKNQQQQFSLTENYITDCEIDKRGQLWIATLPGGIDILEPSNLTVRSRFRQSKTGRDSGLISNWVRDMCWSAGSAMWIGTFSGLSIYDTINRQFQTKQINPFRLDQPMNVSVIKRDLQNNIWTCVDNGGIVVYNPQTRQPILSLSLKDLGMISDAAVNFYNIYTDPQGFIYICSSEGLRIYRFMHPQYKQMHAPGQLAQFTSGEVHCLLKDRNGYTWVGTNKGLYCIDPANNLHHLTHRTLMPGSLLDNNINNIHSDGLGNLWVTSTKGVNLLQRGYYDFSAFSTDPEGNESLDHVFKLLPYNDSMIFSCANAGLFLTNVNSGTIRRIISADRYGAFFTISRLGPQAYIVSSEKELLYLHIDGDGQMEASPIHHLYPELETLHHIYVSCVSSINDSLVLFGCEDEEGVFVWNRRKSAVKQFKRTGNDSSGIIDNHIHDIKTDLRGNTWILGDMAMAVFNPVTEKFEHVFPLPGEEGSINSYFLLDMYDDGIYYWIATYGGGVNRYDPIAKTSVSFTEEDGLSSNAVYRILRENDSILWFSTNKGLTRMNKNSLSFSRYYYPDGLHSNSFDVQSACRIRNALFFGGLDGFTKVARSKMVLPYHSFPVYVTRIVFTERDQQLETKLINAPHQYFNPDTDPITFYFSALGFTSVDRYSFDYRISQLNESWISIGNRNFVTVSGLSPGTYTLRVRVSNMEQHFNEAIPVTFTILPHWYQTWWFRILLGAVIVGIVYAGYRMRIAQLSREESIRKKLATDLHDDLGSTLNSVKVYANLAMLEKNNETHLLRIKESIQDAIVGIRDMIWVLDDKKDTVDHLAGRILQFAEPLCDANGIVLEKEIGESAYNHHLGKEERRNLYMILKETINNSIKYASCKKIGLTILEEAGKLRLMISDDGKGFELASATMGNGIRNIYARAREAGYYARFTSVPGSGTIVELTPL